MGNGLNYVLVSLVALSLIFSGFAAFGKDKVVVNVDQKTLDDAIALAASDLATKNDVAKLEVKVDAISSANTSEGTDNSKLDVLLAKYDDDEEAMALQLAQKELTEKSFEKLLVELLNSNSIANQSVESYKDVEVFVRDSDVSVSGDDAEVEFELRVTFFNDGDSDAEDAEKALVKVTLEVSELDSDEDFEDAEVVDYSISNFELIKIYD